MIHLLQEVPFGTIRRKLHGPRTGCEGPLWEDISPAQLLIDGAESLTWQWKRQRTQKCGNYVYFSAFQGLINSMPAPL